MQKRSTATLVLSCAVMAVAMMTYVSAQRGGGQAPVPASERIRHLVYIGTPGDQGTDNQSGVIVLDADKNYSFVKRISYGLPAAKMPGGESLRHCRECAAADAVRHAGRFDDCVRFGD